MKECVFCDHKGKLTKEHITGKWMNELFPGNLAVKSTDRITGMTREMKWKTLEFQARLVCKKCNETWMSNIESKHAKPVMTPLITGQTNVPIDLAEARSIALYSFKTAVILDHLSRERTPFFDRATRHEFRKSLGIPINVQMWLCGFAGHRGGGHFLTLYHQPKPASGESWLMYVCTFAIGNLAIQVVAIKNKPRPGYIDPTRGFESLAVPFWPGLPRDFIWPATQALRNPAEFSAFAGRWQNIRVTD